MKRKRRRALAAVCAAALLGAGLGNHLPDLAAAYPAGMTAWWGTIYPDFCFVKKTADSGKESGQLKNGGQRRQIKISFFLGELLQENFGSKLPIIFD